MQLLILLVVGFVLWLAIWSLVSVFKMSRHSALLEDLREELRGLGAEVEDLRRQLAARRDLQPPAAQPAAAPAPRAPDPLAAAAPTPVAPAAVPPSAPPVAATQAAAAVPPASLQPAPARGLQPPPIPPPPLAASSQPAPSEPPPAARVADEGPASSRAPGPVAPPLASSPEDGAAGEPAVAFNWEMFMGVRMLAWLGGIAAFFGIALFVKLSIENNWIPPELRVAFAFLAGLGLLVGGLVMAGRGLGVLAHTLCATGVVSLYAVTFACHAHYRFEFFGVLPTFLLMALITAVAFVTAARLRAQVVALLGLLGGFLTPVLVSTGQYNPLGLFSYVALLDVGLVAVALYCRWHYMVPLAAAATALMQAGWSARFFSAERMPVALAVLCGFMVLFLAVSALGRRLRREGAALDAGAAGFAAYSLGFCFVLLGYRALADSPLQPLALLLAADLALLVLCVRARGMEWLQALGSAGAFAWLAAWQLRVGDGALLNWQLGAIFGFSLLHVAFPLVLARLRPSAPASSLVQWYPAAALLLVLLPVLRFPDPGFLVWPVILAIDLLAIGVAVLLGSVLGVLAVLVLSLVAVGATLLGVSSDHLVEVAGAAPSPFTYILLAGLFGLLFLGASSFLLWRMLRGASGPAASPADVALLPRLPALSALLPFVLLVMVVQRMPMEQPHAVLGMALLLSLLLCGLARVLREASLPLVALLSVVVLEWTWHLAGLSAANAAATLAWEAAFYALFSLQAFVLLRRLPGHAAPWLAAAAAGPLQAVLVYLLVRDIWPNEFMGLVPLAFALCSLASLVACIRIMDTKDPLRLDALALLGGVALLFITAVVPVQFDRHWITVGWALEGVALLWLFHRVPHPGLRVAGVLLLALAFARLALNPAILDYAPRGELPVLNWYLWAFGAAIACFLAAARLLAPPHDRLLGQPVPVLLRCGAVVLAFCLLNIEIADFFTAPGERLVIRFSGHFARDMAYTVGWALFAFGLLSLGLSRRLPLARRTALFLFGIALLKLFLHDLATIRDIYRVIAFIAVAALSFVSAFLYLRFARSGTPAPRPPGLPPAAPPPGPTAP